MKWGVRTPRSSWQAFYTGQRQSVSHLADRLRVTVFLPPVVNAVQAGEREAFFAEVSSAGHWLTLSNFIRPVPQGTQRGAPTVYAPTLSGARTLQVQGTAGATLLGGDMIGVSGLLLQVGYAGCVGSGLGVLTVPLALPLLATVLAGAPVTWFKPSGPFELLNAEQPADYSAGMVQAPMQIELAQVLP
jgi:hypothetical protein